MDKLKETNRVNMKVHNVVTLIHMGPDRTIGHAGISVVGANKRIRQKAQNLFPNCDEEMRVVVPNLEMHKLSFEPNSLTS